jgi:putative flippase GtrA
MNGRIAMFRLNSEIRKLTKYVIVGVLNSGVDYVVFCALVYMASFPSAWANLFGYGAGLLNSYYWNRRWTFQVQRRQTGAELLRFVIVNVISFLSATAILLLLEQAGAAPAIAKIAAFPVSLAVNYAGYKLWVFNRIELDTENI